MTNNQPKKPTKLATKKTPAIKKIAAKKTAAKKTPAKKVAAKKAAPKKVVGPYSQLDPTPKQYQEPEAPVAVEPAPEVIMLEKPAWRARLFGIFSK
jgi:hypothetical protein